MKDLSLYWSLYCCAVHFHPLSVHFTFFPVIKCTKNIIRMNIKRFGVNLVNFLREFDCYESLLTVDDISQLNTLCCDQGLKKCNRDAFYNLFYRTYLHLIYLWIEM